MAILHCWRWICLFLAFGGVYKFLEPLWTPPSLLYDQMMTFASAGIWSQDMPIDMDFTKLVKLDGKRQAGRMLRTWVPFLIRWFKFPPIELWIWGMDLSMGLFMVPYFEFHSTVVMNFMWFYGNACYSLSDHICENFTLYFWVYMVFFPAGVFTYLFPTHNF